ncbi:MAG: ATP-binding protein [Treponema sp.]|nr:ATP-binding protein [Treponema sp.]
MLQRLFFKNSRIVARVRVLFFVIPAFLVVLILLLGQFIISSITDDFSRRLARQYSIEAAVNFTLSTNSHFVLMHQISRSTAVAQWMAYKDDPISKAKAFDEIMGYATFAPDVRLMFTMYENLESYDFHVGITLEEFVPWGQLAGNSVSQWFFDTRDAEIPFILNIQRERPELVEDAIVLFVWSNHRVYYQDRFVGVVSVGSPFQHIFDFIFGDFDLDAKRGYIIDRNGRVRMDSAELLAVTELGLPTFPVMPEAVDNPTLYDHINEHLQSMTGGIFQRYYDLYLSEAIPLSVGAFRYGSIKPIIGTDWSVVVLSARTFDLRYLLLIYAGFVALVVSLFIGGILVRRWIVTPLLKLTENVATVPSITDKSEMEIFGVNREDEIGDLARTIRSMWDTQYQQAIEIAETNKQLENVLENELSANSAKNVFLSNMSHEMYTPMNAIMGMTNIGKIAADINKKNYAFEKIEDASHHLLALLTDVLDMANLETDKFELQLSEFSFDKMIDQVIYIAKPLAIEKKHELVVAVDPKIPKKLIGDNHRLAQAINNLLSNAMKFTPNGGNIKLSAKYLGDKNGQCEIQVDIVDTGIGINDEYFKKMFTPFEQEDNSASRKYGGAGLGLAITKLVIQKMGGDVQVESQVGVGSKFLFTVLLDYA